MVVDPGVHYRGPLPPPTLTVHFHMSMLIRDVMTEKFSPKFAISLPKTFSLFSEGPKTFLLFFFSIRYFITNTFSLFSERPKTFSLFSAGHKTFSLFSERPKSFSLFAITLPKTFSLFSEGPKTFSLFFFSIHYFITQNFFPILGGAQNFFSICNFLSILRWGPWTKS